MAWAKLLKLLEILLFDKLHKRTSLHYAAYYGQWACLQLILSAANTTPVAQSWESGAFQDFLILETELVQQRCIWQPGKVSQMKSCVVKRGKSGPEPIIIHILLQMAEFYHKVGLLRCWRLIGDTDVGEFIVPTSQVKHSNTGGRLIIASDGIWDALPSDFAAQSCRGLPSKLAAKLVVKVVTSLSAQSESVECAVFEARKHSG